jgi:hypothetical protein
VEGKVEIIQTLVLLVALVVVAVGKLRQLKPGGLLQFPLHREMLVETVVAQAMLMEEVAVELAVWE